MIQSAEHTTHSTIIEDAGLPVIDLARFPGGDRRARRAVADAIGAACETIGFMYVTGHGVAQPVIDAARSATEAFFGDSAARKAAVARLPGTYRGYVPVMPFSEDRDSGERYLYEAFLIGPELPAGEVPGAGLRWPNLWPDDGGALRGALVAYYRAVDALAVNLLEAFALALGQPDRALLRHFERPMTNISLLHYPARSGDDGQTGANARPHYDTNALTILLPGAVGGLEVEHRERGWMGVPVRPGCFVVNIGNMMEGWSAGRFRSTMHRVHPPAGRERYSIAYFASPDYDTVITPLPGVAPGGEAGSGEPFHAGRAFEAFVAGFDRP